MDSVLEDWRKYKQVVPTYGAILVSDDLTHVLLVQSYWAKNSWGFPKGKINEDEKDTNCAIREVGYVNIKCDVVSCFFSQPITINFTDCIVFMLD